MVSFRPKAITVNTQRYGEIMNRAEVMQKIWCGKYTRAQEYTLDNILSYIIAYDCKNNSPDYEIRGFKIGVTSEGKIVCRTTCGKRKDCNAVRYRFMVIGKRGAIMAIGLNDRHIRGWNLAMMYGAYGSY